MSGMLETSPSLRSRARELCKAWFDAGRYEVSSDAWLRSFDQDFSRELGRNGLIGITWPSRYGGGERTNVERLAVTEELLRAAAPVAAHWMGDRQIGPAILRYGTEQLRTELLPPITSGDAVFCLGMSEPDAGSDLAAVRTRAERVDGGWCLTGAKLWTSHAHHATHAYVLARTEPGVAKHFGLSEFILDMDQPGVSVSPIFDMSGSHHFNEVVFDRVFVPEGRLLGVEGNGWKQVVEQLSFERGGAERVLSTYPLLVDLLATAGQDVLTETTVGSLIARLAVLRQLCWDVAYAVDEGRMPVQEAACLKYLGNTFEYDVIEAYRSLGLAGQAELDGGFARALLAAPGFGIRGGAADVLLSIIVKQETRP